MWRLVKWAEAFGFQIIAVSFIDIWPLSFTLQILGGPLAYNTFARHLIV